MLHKLKIIISKPIVRILIILLTTLLLVKLLLSPSTKQLSIQPVPTPTPTAFSIPTSFIQLPTPSLKPKYQGEPNFRQRIDKEIREAYPLFNITPFSTEYWTIDYTDKMQFTVFLKQDSPQLRQQVLDWITEKGIDPASHKIIWKVNQ